MHDDKLLKAYVESKSDAAFTRLVERHLNFVYTICRRELGNPQLAEDAAQIVFLSLARKAPALRRNVVLAGWLFTASRMACANLRRQETRRRRYEERAAMEAMMAEQPEEWNDVEPLLQDALSSLKDTDRNAILLRFFEGMSLRETGVALGTSEDAARVRVNRAVEKMRRYLAKHGVSVTGASMTASLAQHAVDAAPISPASIVQGINAATAAGAACSIAAGSTGVLRMFRIIKIKSLLAGTAFTACCWSAVAIAGTHSKPQFRAGIQVENNNGPVDGVVQTASGSPVAGAKVLMMDGHITRSGETGLTWYVQSNAIKYETAITDEAGRFHFDHATAQQILVNAEGFGAAGSAIPFRPGPQLLSEPMSIALAPPSELHLRFVDANNNPVSGLVVTPLSLTVHGSGFQLPTTWRQTTSKDGSVIFSDLPQGANVTIETNNELYGRSEAKYQIAEASTTEIAAVHLDQAGSISGTVTFAGTGRPAVNIKVLASIPNKQGVTTSTDQFGHYTAAPLPAGEYYITPMLPSLLQDKWTARDAVRTLSSGMRVTGANISLIKGARISGQVTYSDTHKPAATVSVNIGALENNTNIGLTTLMTDSEGLFHYRTPGRRIYVQAGSMDSSDARQYFVNAIDGKDQTVNIEIARPVTPATLKGIVFDPAGNPVSGAEVVAFPTSNVRPMSAKTDSNGKFALLIAGTRMVTVRARFGISATVETPMALAGADDVTLRLVDNTLGSMSGKVLDREGKALTGISITAVQWNANRGQHIAQATTGTDGGYHFAGLWPGMTYSVGVENAGYGPAVSRQVQIIPGKDVNLNTVTLLKIDSYVAGRIINSHGLPAAGAHVAWMDENSHNTIADAQGRFRLNGVTGGNVSLMVGAGNESAYKDVQANRDDIIVRTQEH